MDEKKNILTDTELDEVVDAAAYARAEAGDNKNMEIIKNNVEVDENAELEKSEVVTDGDPADLAAMTVDTMPASDASLFDIEGDTITVNGHYQEDASNSIAGLAKDTYDLTDEEVVGLLDIISNMRNNEKYPVYKNLPKKLQDTVKELAMQNNIPASQYNALARMIMLEFISDSEMQNVFIDIEKSLNEALKMPSVIDLYTEHTRTVMEENIPKMIDEIKEAEPEKAALLLKVKDQFTKSYTYSFAKEMYENNAQLRKAVRKHDKHLKRALDEFNFKNEKSNFKMNDVRELPEVLTKILITDPIEMTENADEVNPITELAQKILDFRVTENDIAKFCIMICKSCENLNSKDVVDASYMYYMMKNIIVLKYSNEAKTEFAAELISNICDTITFIRDKEAEFNAANLDKSKS